jgi:hypothetical protein
MLIIISFKVRAREVMSCKGICIRHRAKRPAASYGRYATGQKRCQICAIYMKWDGMWCPCYGSKVRTRPHNSKSKQKFILTSFLS